MSEYRKQLEERDGVSRVFCLKCNTLYQDPNGYPIGFTVRYCCSQETETNQERIDFLVTDRVLGYFQDGESVEEPMD